jgi:hypothetical protein
MLLALLSASTTLGVPMDRRLEDLQCRCLSVSTDAKPTPCTYMESYKLDWHAASSLASDYDLKIQFASQNTIVKVLSIPRQLPSSVLESIREGEAMSIHEQDLTQRENKIVCAFGDEMEYLDGSDSTLEPEYHFVGYIGASFMVLIAFYLLAQYAWARYVYQPISHAALTNSLRRFFAQGSIKLEGDEKALMVDYEASSSAQEKQNAPTDFS